MNKINLQFNPHMYKLKTAVIVFLFGIFVFKSSGCMVQDEQLVHQAVLNKLILEEDLRISADHSDVLLGVFGGVAVDDDNMIYAADTHLGKIHIFAPDGSYSGSLGQRGEGPAEFMNLDPEIRISGDILYVNDTNNYRVNMFDLESRQPSGTIIIPNEPLNGVPMGAPRDMQILSNDAILLSYVNPYIFSPEEDESPKMITLSLVNKSGEFAEKNVLQIPSPFPTNQKLALISDSGMSVFSNLIFYPDVKIAVNSEGYLYVGTTDSLRIEKYNRNGELKDILELEYENIRFTNTHYDSLAANQGHTFATAINSVGRPDFWPVFQDFFFDDQNRMWIELINPQVSEKKWWVISKEGEPEWEVNLPENMNLLYVKNNQAYGIFLNEDDISVIMRYNISSG